MTEIQAIIDKLEAEANDLRKGCDPHFCIDLETGTSRLRALELIIQELKKHLPKEDKSSFKIETTHGFIEGRVNKNNNAYLLYAYEEDPETFITENILNKYQIKIVILALQAAHKEMEDEK